MTVSVTVDGDEATFVFERAAGAAVVADTVEAAARYIYPVRWGLTDGIGRLIPFDDLSEAQRLNVLDREMGFHLREMARAYYVKATVDAARDGAEVEAGRMFDL